MTYVVVGVGGQLHTRRRQPTRAQLMTETGTQPLARTHLRHLPAERPNMCIYTPAHDNNHTWPRNPVGAATAATFGAEQYPYAGPVIFVGWTSLTPNLTYPLPPALITAVTEVHTAVVLALAGAQAAFGRVWSQAVRDYGRRVREVPAPEWVDVGVRDLFGRDVTGRSWWVCPVGGCGHAGMFHAAGVCVFTGCDCGKRK